MLNRLLPWLFAALVGPLCLFLAVTVPPGEAPDEPAHAVRADSVWRGEIMGHRAPAIDAAGLAVVEAVVTADRALLQVTSTFPPQSLADKRLTRERWTQLDNIEWTARPSFVSAPNVAVYLPVPYLPAAIGLGVARAAGLGPLRSVLTARVCNAVAFLCLGVAALATAQAARLLIFVTLCLPMTLWLAAAINPDGILIALACLGAAGLTRFEGGRSWPQWLAGTCIALMGAAKPSYLPLALAMLVDVDVARRDWPSLRGQAYRVVLVALPGFLWAAIAAVTVAAPFYRPAYLPGPFWPGDPGIVFHSTDVGAQLLVVASGPWRVFTVVADWLAVQARHDAIAAIGVLGLLDLVLPTRLYQAWVAAGATAAVAAMLDRRTQRQGASSLGAAAIAAGALASVLAICVLMYLSWTSVGATSIEGIQGRYFLPLAPFLGVALSAIRVGDRPRSAAAMAVGPILVAAISAVVVARMVVTTYYLR